MNSTSHQPELESVKSQVADLARELAERDRSMQVQSRHLEQTLHDLREQSRLLRAIIEDTAAETGDEFFSSLVVHLTTALNVHYALVGEVIAGGATRIRTLAVSAGGTLVDNFEFDLERDPCGADLTQPFWCFEQGVQTRFPRFPHQATPGVDGFCGVPLRTKAGAVVGLLIVMDTKPLHNSERLKWLMEVVAAQATAEFRRRQAEAARREAERRLRFTQFAVDHAVDAVFWADDSKRFIYANDAACRSLGYSQDELLALSIPDIAPLHDPARFQQRLEAMRRGSTATYEAVHRRKDGTEFPVEVSIAYLEHEGKGYICGIVRDITERKRAEQERWQALQDLRNVMETVPDLLFTLDTHGHLVNWNSRVGEVTGYSPEELRNKPALAFVPAEEQDQTAAAIQRAFMDGYAELDGHLRTKDGRAIPYHWTGAVLKHSDGRIIGIAGVGRDVSEKRRAEVELTKQRQHLVEAQALAHLGSWEWDIGSGTMEWSDEQFRIFGYAPQSMPVTHETFLAALLPDDHDRVLAAINDALAGNAPYDVECRIVRPTGEVRTIHMRGKLARDPGGRAVAMSGTVLDITERKQAEEALRQNHALLSAVMDAASDIIFVKDLHGRYVHMNRAGARRLGMPAEEVIGWNDYAVWPSELAASCQAADRRVLEKGETVTVEEAATLDGKPTVFLTTKAPYRDPEGRILGVIGVARDITERKRAEEALRKSESRLNDAQRIAHIGSWELDLVSNRLVWSDEVYRIFEIAPHGFGASYEAFLDLVHPDDRDAVDRAYRSSLIQRTPYEIVHRILLPSGRVKFVRERCETRYDQNGRPLVSMGTIQDITEQRQVEETLRQRERDLRAALEERERISQDLHDCILQSLYATGLGIESCKPLIKRRQSKRALAVMEQAIGQLNHVMAEVRNFIAGLESRVLHGGDLASALRSMAQTMTAPQPITCRVAVDESAAQRISTEQALNLLHVVREALSNSLRHGRATRATVSLKSLTRSVRLSVIDNGAGFEPARAAGIGHGLPNMAARASRMGGRFAVRSKPGRGTRITIDLPKKEAYGDR